ncbi:MAG TPA: glycosyltransferase [Pseudomonas xinjiangensis]|uniref:Glycosyltransferase n=2 Tax=root TaxID=1 RepID=A0A7V1FSW0_9GAMM|nr:glycosyltransferase [Halopseudomonas xinjiangensis]HEC48135.1 glycosyltransferase [Halopseudomonas xinjiangensis]
MQKIFAVVLTYNRKNLLEKCLEAIYQQTRPCDGVIVVDNGSSDGTEQMLLDLEHTNLEIHVLSENIGASGGFNAGFRLAFQGGADFVWMMDDDVIADPDALQRLLEADDVLDRKAIERAFLLSTAFTENGLITNAPSMDVRLNRIRYENWPLTLEHGLAPVRRATFVSILVPRQTLETYGLPIASMFIWGEDTEYTLRITEKVPGYIVGNSKVLHLRQESGAISILAETNTARLKYHRHYVRNEVFVARKYYRQRRSIMTVAHQFSLMFQLALRGDFRKACIVLQGVLESSRFFPATEAADTPIESLGITVRSLTSSRRGAQNQMYPPRKAVEPPEDDRMMSEQSIRAFCN